MDGFVLINQGAEAKLYKGTYLGKLTLLKERFIKKYRHPDLDTSITKERIKAESRALLKCKNAGIKTPMIYLVDMQRRSIYMEYIDFSITAKEFIFQADELLLDKLCDGIGVMLGRLHCNNIIHGDLTTSNILVANKSGESRFDDYAHLQLVLIDFGLAHIETNVEDKAVDLYVLERALLSTHSIHDTMFSKILVSYRKNNKSGCKEVLAKLDDVRARGRKRTMVG